MPVAADPTNRTGDRTQRALLGVCALLSAVLYLPVLIKLAGQWLGDSNYRHGLLIPLVSGLFLWRSRESLKKAVPGGGEIAGLMVIALASVFLVGGTAACELFTTRLSIPLLIIGTSLFLVGKDFTKRAAFPLLLLFFMIPLPYIIYYKITFPLQLMSARLSAAVLGLLEVSVIRKGNILLMPNYALEVVAACSGLRSLMTMITLALIYAGFSALSNVRKIMLVAFAIPAAIAANTLRLVVTAVGAHMVGPSFADGVLHEISGLIVFLSGLLMIMIAAGILKWVR